MAAGKGAEVGNGYVLIKPTMDDSAVKGLQAKGTAAGHGFGGAFQVAAGNLIANAVQALGAAVADTFRTAFDNYANYEQLVGGVETLFKESSDVVQRNAARAYETAGMSANQYMEQVTSFSASLLQSLNGDTAEAAKYADMAMVDMSDNANKMGTDMGRITDAYQGFAKQNYTMLDNLKLGYGGTKSEMERLLADASKIAGVEFNIDSYSDVIQAIHVMQENMGIAGTTAEEATETISGSINKLKASWSNFLTGIMDENADLGALGEQLLTSVGDVLKNVVPRIGTLVQNVVLGLPGAIVGALTMLPEMLAPTITAIFGEQIGGQMTEALGGATQGILDVLSQLSEAAMPVLENLGALMTPIIELVMSVANTVAPLVMEALGVVIGFVTGRLLPTVSAILATVQPVVQQITSDIQAKMPAIQSVIQSAMNVVKGVIDTVWPHVQGVVMGAVNTISAVVSAAWPVISRVIDVATSAIQAVITHVWPVVQSIIEGVCSAVEGIASSVWPAVSGIVETACGAISGAIDGLSSIAGIVGGIFEAARSAIEDPIGAARDFISGAIDTIKGLFNFHIEWPYVPMPHFEVWGSPNPLDWLTQGTPGFSIEWYASGGMVDDATLIGAGERGAELIWPSYDPYLTRYADAIASRMDARGRTTELLEALLDKSGDVYLDGRLVGKVIAPFVDAQFAASGRRLAHV